MLRVYYTCVGYSGKDCHTAVFGGIEMKRACCSKCEAYALVSEGRFLCCDGESTEEPRFAQRVVEGHAKRLKPSREFKRRQIELQHGKCFYCNISLDAIVYRDDVPIQMRPVFDHIVPFAYSHNDEESNFVAACQICNGIKSAMMFDTLEEYREHIRRRRDEKGYHAGDLSEL